MNSEMETLARRAVACKGWRWLPGMLGRSNRRIIRVVYPDPPVDDTNGIIPDLRDPATLGALLALVRVAFDEPSIFAQCHPIGARWQVHSVDGGIYGEGDTEAAALVAALEAANE